MQQPLKKHFHDPLHYDMQCDVYAEHVASLRTFDVDPALAATLEQGQIIDENSFQLKTIVTTKN